uniref:Uncharacterized protein n=1 Tax=Megaselia scalaris TaxID=36166 RepID=T1GGS0_MEGSC
MICSGELNAIFPQEVYKNKRREESKAQGRCITQTELSRNEWALEFVKKNAVISPSSSSSSNLKYEGLIERLKSLGKILPEGLMTDLQFLQDLELRLNRIAIWICHRLRKRLLHLGLMLENLASQSIFPVLNPEGVHWPTHRRTLE